MFSIFIHNFPIVTDLQFSISLTSTEETIIIGSQNDIWNYHYKKAPLVRSKGSVLPIILKRPLGSFLFDFGVSSQSVVNDYSQWNNAVENLSKLLYFRSSNTNAKNYYPDIERKVSTFFWEQFCTGSPVHQYSCLYLWNEYLITLKQLESNQEINLQSQTIHSDSQLAVESFQLYAGRLIHPILLGKVIENEQIYPPVNNPEHPDDVNAIFWFPWGKWNTECVLISHTFTPIIRYYLKNLSKNNLKIQYCEICNKPFLTNTLHRKVCGENCKEALRIKVRKTYKDRTKNVSYEKRIRSTQSRYDRAIKKFSSNSDLYTTLIETKKAFNQQVKEQKKVVKTAIASEASLIAQAKNPDLIKKATKDKQKALNDLSQLINKYYSALDSIIFPTKRS